MLPRVVLPKISLNKSTTGVSEIKIEADDSDTEEDSDNYVDMVESGPDVLKVGNRASQPAPSKDPDYKQKCLQKYEAAKRELLSMLKNNADADDFDTEEESSENLKSSMRQKFHPSNENSQKSDTQTDNSTLARVLKNQQSMLQMLKILSANQKKLTQEVSSLKVKLDETYLTLLLRENMDTSVVFNENTNKFKQIQTREDFEHFESKISDDNEKQKVMNQLSYLCNSSIEGSSCFYRLIDVLFSRQLLNEYSWAGGSRSDKDKMIFKTHRNIIDLVFQLVNFWDPNFTLQNTEILLKTVLRNSKQRMESKLMRASTSKNRKKRIEIAQIDVTADVYSEYEDNTHDTGVKTRRILQKKDRNDAVKLETRKRRKYTETSEDTDDESNNHALKLPIKIRKKINQQENKHSDSNIEKDTANETQYRHQEKNTKNIKNFKQTNVQVNEDSAGEIEIEITKIQGITMQQKNVDVLNSDDFTTKNSAELNKNATTIKQQVNEDSEIENESNEDADFEEDSMDHELEDTAAIIDSDNSEKTTEHNMQRKHINNRDITKETCSTNLFGMKPIENFKEFEEFEALISDRTKKQKLMNHCSFLCTPAIGKGVTFAYRLVDEMFPRHFLCECSWSGGTRSMDSKEKIPFKKFKNTVQFLYLMVNFWDPEYSIEKNERFIKTILRNAKARANMERVKAVHQKNRPTVRRKALKHRNDHNDGDMLSHIVLTDSAAISEDAEGTIDVLETDENVCELFNSSNVRDSSPNNNKSLENDDTVESVKIKPLNIKAIRSLQELEKFEAEIADVEVQQKLVEKYSTLWPKLKGNGTAFAYNLLDSMFSKEFLCDCSWVGGSKSGKTKTPIRQYKNMLKFFFQLVHHSDSNYSFEDLETFFKVVLRNSQQRLLQGPRKSSGRISAYDGPNESTAKEYGMFDMNPIETEEELQKFNKLLSNNEQKTTIMNQFSVLFPISLGKGITCSYRLIDALFSRRFLCECSWAGGSRGEDFKICFRQYKNTINFFFQMVSFWDPSYTEDNNKNFIKTVLRNAKSRAESKMLRASAQRNRRKKNSLSSGIDPLCFTLNNESANEENAQKFLRLFKDTLQSACDDDDD